MTTLLNAKVARFNDMHIELPLSSSVSVEAFKASLTHSLAHWRSEGRTAAWLRLPSDAPHAALLPTALDAGFRMHHVRTSNTADGDDALVLSLWLKDDETNRIPSFAHTTIGVGGFCVDATRTHVLVVREQVSFSPAQTRAMWKLPGGYVDPRESLATAVAREVREETGVDVRFESIQGFRHAHPGQFGCSDIYFVALCVATAPMDATASFAFDTAEIAEVRWAPLADYAGTSANALSVNAFNQLVARDILAKLEAGAGGGGRLMTVEESLFAAYKRTFNDIYSCL